MSVAPNTSSSTLAIQNVSSVTINDNLFHTLGQWGKSIFADMILFFLTIFLMRELIKWSLTFGEWPIQDVMKPLTKFVENYAKSAPVLWWFSVASAQSSFKEQRKKMAEGMGMTPQWRFQGAEDAFQSRVNSLFGMQDTRSNNDYKELTGLINAGNDVSGANFFWKTVEKAKERQWGISVGDGARKELLQKRLEKNKYALRNQGWWSDYDGTLEQFLWGDKELKNSFASKNRKKLNELMWGRANSNDKAHTPTETPTYDQLMKLRYYEPKS